MDYGHPLDIGKPFSHGQNPIGRASEHRRCFRSLLTGFARPATWTRRKDGSWIPTKICATRASRPLERWKGHPLTTGGYPGE